MSHYANPSEPIGGTDPQAADQARRKSRLYSQIIPVPPPAHSLSPTHGAAFVPAAFVPAVSPTSAMLPAVGSPRISGLRSTPVPPFVNLRRDRAPNPIYVPENLPGLVPNPAGFREDAPRYRTSPHPSAFPPGHILDRGPPIRGPDFTNLPDAPITSPIEGGHQPPSPPLFANIAQEPVDPERSEEDNGGGGEDGGDDGDSGEPQEDSDKNPTTPAYPPNPS